MAKGARMIRIASGQLSAEINPFGAELSSLKDAEGRELMTDADPAYWTGRAPILFPIVGALYHDTYRIEGREFSLQKHGFARRMDFEVVEAAPDRATFRLTDSEATRALYPWPFALDIVFAIAGATLSIEVTVGNPGDTALLASFGFHPAFAWPLPYGRDRADHRIVFEADEGELRKLTADGLIALEPRTSPLDGRTLHLADDLFVEDALIWDPVHSRKVIYGASDGPQLVVEFPDTNKLGIWTKPGAHYVCIEPWHGIADPAGFTGEFRDKPGVFGVVPHGATQIRMQVTLTD
jgi:galactose mutarotase-like enzyme